MMYRLEERDFLLSRFREMQRFSLFSQPSLSLVEQSRFFRFTRTCDARVHTFKDDESRRGIERGAFLFAGTEPRLSPLSETRKERS